MTVETSEQSTAPVGDLSFALALAVLRERVGRLPIADQDDLDQLLPDLLHGDEEARDSAQRAVAEILEGVKGTLSPLRMNEGSPDPLSGWMTYFATKLKQARTKAGLTQQQLGEASGIPQSHISRLEAGLHSASSKTIEKLTAALGLPASHFDPCGE
ncbi:MAG: helix-turn-helix transcriptional regulator [Planctomycetaceae bacterium]|nr:helix-turn-helix transcriptional regulator [Planctomycetaceae bacterium]